MSEQLCDVFGGRMDEASWRTVNDDEPFDPPCDAAEDPTAAPVDVSRQVAPLAPRAVDVPRVVLDEPFDRQSTLPGRGGRVRQRHHGESRGQRAVPDGRARSR